MMTFTPPRRRPLRARTADEQGSALVEIIACLPILVIAALLAVQMQLFVSTAVAAENAARNASRALRDGGDAYLAARSSLSPSQAARLRAQDVQVQGERVTVSLQVPGVVHALPMPEWSVDRAATVPRRSSSGGPP